MYERNVALYNLAALYAHIGTTGARRDEEGLKTCLAALQVSAVHFASWVAVHTD